jgi:hypothetical protein
MNKHLATILIVMFAILAGYFLRFYQEKIGNPYSNLTNQQLLDLIPIPNNASNQSNDPLCLYKDNPQLDECLKKVNPSDPLGLTNETEIQKTQREACINNYTK